MEYLNLEGRAHNNEEVCLLKIGRCKHVESLRECLSKEHNIGLYQTLLTLSTVRKLVHKNFFPDEFVSVLFRTFYATCCGKRAVRLNKQILTHACYPLHSMKGVSSE
mmetsp:Transcript_32055/g.89742  ORF Transcript_32055/g.89742 Transcript_32055/m.89742 type:complete len:107 (+) Transcript_32055:515-835(+)